MGHLIFSVTFLCDLFASINKENKMFLICNALTCFRLYCNRFSCCFERRVSFLFLLRNPCPTLHPIHNYWSCAFACLCTSNNPLSMSSLSRAHICLKPRTFKNIVYVMLLITTKFKATTTTTTWTRKSIRRKMHGKHTECKLTFISSRYNFFSNTLIHIWYEDRHYSQMI